MSDEDQVAVQFIASIDGLTEGVSQVKEQISGIGETAQGLTETFALLGEGIAAAFGIDKLQEFIEKTADMGVDMNRMESQLGMTAEQMNVLRVAAEGEDTQMQLVTRSITQFARMTYEAEDPMSKVSAAFNVLGINAKEYLATGHNINDLFELTVKRVSEYADSENKAAVVSALFGGRSSQLIAVLDNLGQHHEELAGIVQRSGSAMSGFEAQSILVKDKLIELDASERGFEERVQSGFLPIILRMEQGFINLVQSMQDLLPSMQTVQNALDTMDEFIDKCTDSIDAFLNAWTQTWDKAKTILNNDIDAMKSTWSNFKSFFTGNYEQNTTVADKELKQIDQSNSAIVSNITDIWKGFGSTFSNIWSHNKSDAEKYLEDITSDVSTSTTQWAEDTNKAKDQMGQMVNADAIKKAMDEDIKAHKEMLALELADTKNNLVAQMILEGQYFDWLKGKYPQNSQAAVAAARQMENTQNQVAAKSKQDWDGFFNSFNSGIMGMIRGTSNWRQAAQSAADNVLMHFLKMGESWLSDWISKQVAATAATNTGNAARVASDTQAAAASKAATAAIGQAQIMQDANKAAAGAYSAVAGIPIVGPVLAPVAAGVAFAAVEAYQSFDVGTWNVPMDMVANLHAGERVMTAQENASYSANGGGGGQPIQLTFNGPTDKQYFMQNQTNITAAITRAIRLNSPPGAK